MCRYHMAFLSMTQKQANRAGLAAKKLHPLYQPLAQAPPRSAKVCDGVSVGFRMSLCRVERPWLVPNNLQMLRDEALTSVPASTAAPTPKRHVLFEGSSLPKYTMITDHKIRHILADLSTEGTVVSINDYNKLISWLQENRPQVVPFVSAQQVRTQSTYMH